jgi:type III pantothenate kinase
VSPDVVADVGNTRIKWAACAGGVVGEMIAVEDDESQWAASVPSVPSTWVIASVRPERSERLKAWLEARGHRVRLLSIKDLSLRVDLEHPEKTGIDRLVNAVAATTRLAPGEPAVLVSAGSAVTVDLLDASHTFRGGTISPGLDLMAEALHRFTALLPRVTVTLPLPPLPGRSTVPAIQRGIYHAVVGGIKDVAAAYGVKRVFLTGGQAPLLAPALPGVELWPKMTLVGILSSVEGIA